MKNIKTIFTTILITSALISPALASFSDVSSDYIYADAINYAQEQGIVKGFEDGEFKPERTITRAEFTKIIVNAKFSEDEIQSCGTFEDYIIGADDFTTVYSDIYPDVNGGGYFILGEKVDSTCVPDETRDFMDVGDGCEYKPTDSRHKFYNFICMSTKNSMTRGYEDGTFRPNNPITVGEASKIISNAYGLTNIQSGPEGDVFKPFVDALAGKKALPQSLVSLDTNLRRGEMAEIVYRLENSITGKSSKNYLDIKFIQYTVKDPVVDCSNLFINLNIPSNTEITYTPIDKNDVVGCLAVELKNNSYTIDIGAFEPGAGCLDLENPVYVGEMKNGKNSIYRVGENDEKGYYYQMDYRPEEKGCTGSTASMILDRAPGALAVSCEGSNVEICDEVVRSMEISK